MIEQHLSLVDRESVIVGVAHHVRPTKVPRLVGGGRGEDVVHLVDLGELRAACPTTQHRFVVGSDVLSGTLVELNPGLCAGDEC